VQNAYITVLGEMVGGGVSDATLGAEVAARIEPWIGLVERKVEHLLAGSPLKLLVCLRDLAFGLVALYFGVDMLSHRQADRARRVAARPRNPPGDTRRDPAPDRTRGAPMKRAADA
jgi:hypothetical protein